MDLNLQGPRSVRRKCPGRLECTELSRGETGSGRVRRLRVPRGDVGGGTGRGAEAAGGGAERERGRDTPGGGGGADRVQSEGGPQSNVPNVPQRVLNWGLTCLAGDPSADRAVTRAWSQVGKVAGDGGVVESGAVARWENRLEPPAVGPKPSPSGQGPATPVTSQSICSWLALTPATGTLRCSRSRETLLGCGSEQSSAGTRPGRRPARGGWSLVRF